MAERPESRIIYMKVWQAPVRIAHWLMFASVVTLGITGYLIGNPPFSAPVEASRIYTFGTIRFLHFLAGYALLASFLLRLYWGFVGNRFSRWVTMLPVRKWQWRWMGGEISSLLWPRIRYRVYTGHSPLGNVSYLLVYLGVLFSIVTGFTLYAHQKYTPFWRTLGAWGLALFGHNLNFVHLLHHLMLWFFAIFLVVHLYLVVYTMVVTRTTEIDTMISGKKFVFEEELASEAEKP